jgi:Domain of unknown function (DUF4082)/F5/8 type C domain/Secretion system C-terminal sorting domain
MKKFISGILCGLLVIFFNEVKSQNVWTQHNDQGRTGWYPFETTLNQSNVNQNTFGIQFNHVVDEKIVAQPLVIMNVNISGIGSKNVVYVATQNNSVYAFDADVSTVNPYWHTNFTNSITPGGPACTNCRPVISDDIHPSLCGGGYSDFGFYVPAAPMGIVGTPVIDTTSGTIYFVTKIVNMNDGTIDNHGWKSTVPFDEYSYTTTGFHQYLHAVDITNGTERANSPVEIKPQGIGLGDGQIPAGSHNIPFNPRTQFNRAGLALNNGKVYIAFAAHCDNNPSHGWIVSYDATNMKLVNSYMTTPNDGRGGIWMSGVAPAIDATGNIYFSNGNDLNEGGQSTEYNIYDIPSSSPTLAANRGEGVVKLTGNLTLSDYFTPFDYVFLNNADLDFSAQVMLLPNTNLAMAGCKDDSLFIFDRSNMGQYSPARNFNLQRVYVGNTNAEMHSTFGYFGGPTPYAYQFSENTNLQQYTIDPTAGLTLFKVGTLPIQPVASGGFLSSSSNGSDPTTGILWVYQSFPGCTDCNGTLYAMDATDITHQLWNSDLVPADNITQYNKFSCPTIALGKVYVAANKNQLVVYGTKVNTNCSTNQALNKNATALTNNNTANNVTDGNAATSWTGLPQDVDSIYIDLGGSYDICKVIINWDVAGFGKDFDMKISPDGMNWTTIKSVRSNALTTTEFDGAVTARFVSMVGITRGTVNGYSINEFQIFGNVSAACPPSTGLNASPGSNITVFTFQGPLGAGALDGNGSVELGAKFRSSVPGFITGVRFYKTAGYSGTHTGELYSYPGGTLLASKVFSGETASGWQTVSFDAPVAIAANTTYIAAFYDQVPFYSADNFGLQTSTTNLNLTELADGTDGPNGVYAYSGTPTYPTSTFASSNYWVDAIFSTNVPADPHTQMLTWDAFPGATQYTINYRPSLSASWLTRTSTTNGIVISALSCNTLYDFTVQANCGSNLSVVSQGTFTPTGCSVTTCDPFPSGFFNVDLGDIGVAGSTCLNGNVYTLSGSGTDIGGIADQFQFGFTSIDIADYEVFGRITQQDAAPATNKIGVMVRDSMTNTSRFAYLASLNDGSSYVFEYRSIPGGAVTTVPLGAHPIPYWVQIRKIGTTYAAYMSPDNVTWTLVAGPVDLNFGNNASNAPHYGMAVTSANNTLLASGKIDNFKVTASSPLPIRLIGFTAKNINDDHVLVSWTTTMEHLVDHFEIERSVDNSHFEMIAKVTAVGESETPHNYSAVDNNPVAGVSYYQLKELDKDGNFYYSPIVSVTFDQKEGLEIYPNPAGSYTSINSLKNPIVEVSLYDVTGKLLQNMHAASGQTTFKLNTTELAQGVYIIRVSTTTGIYRQKLFKQ